MLFRSQPEPADAPTGPEPEAHACQGLSLIHIYFPEQVISPEDILMEKETEREQEAAHALMMERLREALALSLIHIFWP